MTIDHKVGFKDRGEPEIPDLTLCQLASCAKYLKGKIVQKYCDGVQEGYFGIDDSQFKDGFVIGLKYMYESIMNDLEIVSRGGYLIDDESKEKENQI